MKMDVRQKSKMVSLVIGILAVILPFSNCKKEEAKIIPIMLTQNQHYPVLFYLLLEMCRVVQKIKPGYHFRK